MELNNLQTQKTLNYQGISELKVSVATAKKLHENNGLDELYFRAGNKDYVLFGQGLELKSLNNPVPTTLNGQQIEFLDRSNEINTASEGLKDIFNSVKGRTITALGVIGGGYAALKMTGRTPVPPPTHMPNFPVPGPAPHFPVVGTTLPVSGTTPGLSPRPTNSPLNRVFIGAAVVGSVALIGTAVYGAYTGANKDIDYESIHMSSVGVPLNPAAKK